MLTRIFGMGLMALVTVACSTATPYQAASDTQSYGFTNQMIEDDRAVVRFAGNSLTEQKTVETYMLYRAAELTREKGFDYFNVVNTETDEERRYIPLGFTYDPYYSNFYCRYRPYGYGNHPFRQNGRFHASFGYGSRFNRYGFGYGIYDSFLDAPLEVTRYEAESEIIFGRGQKPSGKEYFDAAQVLKNLGSEIIRPEMLEG